MGIKRTMILIHTEQLSVRYINGSVEIPVTQHMKLFNCNFSKMDIIFENNHIISHTKGWQMDTIRSFLSSKDNWYLICPNRDYKNNTIIPITIKYYI